MANAYRDQNNVTTLIASSNVDGLTPVRIYADPVTHRLLVDTGGSSAGITSINTDTTAAQTLTVGTSGTDFAIVDNGTGDHKFNLPTASHTNRGALSSADWDTFNSKGSGTVTAVSIATANGFSGSSSGGATPALTIVAGAIVPTSVNGVVFSGSSTPTLAVTGTTTVSGANTGDQNIFASVPVSGQTTVTASSTSTALTLVAGSGVTITTDNTAKSVTFAASGGSGTVTTLSVATANGFAGSVANPTTTPAITLTTSITGILQGNGTAISAATTTGSNAVVLATSPTLVTPILGTPTSGTLTNCGGIATSLTSGITNALKSATTTVDVSAATAPSSGQVLTATSGTAATWQTPSAGPDYSCRVFNSGSNSVTTGLNVLNFDSENFDTDTMHDNVTNNSRITFKHAGKYMVTGTIMFGSTVNGVGAFILLNGTTYLAGGGGGSLGTNPSTTACVSTVYSFSANDYVELVGSINSGTLSTLTSTSFGAFNFA